MLNPLSMQNENQSNQERINLIIDSLIHQSEQFQNYMVLSKKQRKREQPQFLGEHQLFLTEIIDKLRNVNVIKSSTSSIPHSSTPYRNNENRKPRPFSIGSPLANSSEHFHLFHCLDKFLNKFSFFSPWCRTE